MLGPARRRTRIAAVRGARGWGGVVLARKVPDSGGVIVVPGFAGLGAPHSRPDARGLISGLTRGTTAADIARATLEVIALQIAAILRDRPGGPRVSVGARR